MAKYFITKKAVEDLSSIWDYTFETWSEKQADEYYSSLIREFESIACVLAILTVNILKSNPVFLGDSALSI